MKKYILIISLLFFASFSIAQENIETEENKDEIKTLFGDIKSHGFYGAFSLKAIPIDGKDGIGIGGRFGWVINHRLVVGVAGYGFFNEQKEFPKLNQFLDPNNKYNIAGGCGGFFFEPIIAPQKPIHLSFPILIGAGGAVLMKDMFEDKGTYNNQENEITTSSFFVLEPGVEVEMNVFKFLRVSVGAYYRYTSSITLEKTFTNIETNKSETIKFADEDVLKGFSFGINFKFGRF